MVMPTKFHGNRAKIEEFLLIATLNPPRNFFVARLVFNLIYNIQMLIVVFGGRCSPMKTICTKKKGKSTLEILCFCSSVENKSCDYFPLSFFRPPMIKVNDKVMIPQEEHPEINFVGLLIGPRGNTLKCKLNKIFFVQQMTSFE